MPRLASVMSLPRIVWLLGALLLASAPAHAQDTARQAPAHIALVEGTAVLERDGVTDNSPGSMPLLSGDRLRTRAGRVEVLYAEGSTLHMDHHTVVDFQSDEVIRLLEGRIRLNIAGPSRQVAFRVDAPTAWVEIRQPGEYRVALVAGDRGAEVELAVLRGAADLVNEDGSTDLLAGERAFAQAGLAPSIAYVFNSAAWDGFDQWSEARRDQRLGISAQYLPPETRPYAGALDSYGDWRYETTYGYVWYPRVAVGWRPYYSGRWSHLRPWGWTWIGRDPWAWPTHHYGRWGFSAGLWFWIPGHHWGPAWVSWAYAPGYVSWCPLGWNNRPVFGFIGVTHFGGRRYNPWHGWTVVPHRRFGSGFVNINVVNINHIDARTRGAFAERLTPPQYTGRAVPRSQTPITVAGSRTGVPRSGTAGVRDRGAAGERLSGPGFPAPARAPRSAVPSSGERSAPVGSSRERDASGQSIDRGSTPRAVPRSGAPAVTSGADRGTPSRRAAPAGARAPASGGPGPERSGAVPRATRPDAEATPPRSAPSRAAPRGRGSSSTPAQGQEPAATPAPNTGRSRAVPRGSGGSASSTPAPRSYRREPAPAASSAPAPRSYRREPAPAPSDRAPVPGQLRGRERSAIGGPSYGVPDRSIRRAPEPTYQVPRSMPRGTPAGPPAPVYRSPGTSRSSGGMRSVPSGPRPAPAPGAAQPAPRQGAPSSASPSRSRGGQHSSGPARPRGGGNK
ncbi:MAG TPA: DUF6600 domain-containing protein [Vicinamibacterales bacterium]|nr:DUF6600 domain-containing protein [Vicinamibacterales bacterium]